MSLTNAGRGSYEKTGAGCAGRHYPGAAGTEHQAGESGVAKMAFEGKGGKNQGREKGQRAGIGDGMTIDDREGAAFVAGEQLGSRHAMRDGAGRIIQRELVFEAPGKDTHAEHEQSRREDAQDRTVISQ